MSVIVTTSASSPALTMAPVVLLADDSVTAIVSSPSTKESSIAATENTIGVSVSPSSVAVNVSTPLPLSKVAPVVVATAVFKAANKSA